MMDIMNKNMTDGIMAKKMEKMGLKEAVHSHSPSPGPNTHINGSQSIDGIWKTSKIRYRGPGNCHLLKI